MILSVQYNYRCEMQKTTTTKRNPLPLVSRHCCGGGSWSCSCSLAKRISCHNRGRLVPYYYEYSKPTDEGCCCFGNRILSVGRLAMAICTSISVNPSNEVCIFVFGMSCGSRLLVGAGVVAMTICRLWTFWCAIWLLIRDFGGRFGVQSGVDGRIVSYC